MKIYTVTFFGHRDFLNRCRCDDKLSDIIKELIYEKEYVDFWVGRNGDFDIFASSSVKLARRECGSQNSSLVLVLPYNSAEYENNKEYFEEYYDEIIICPEAANAHHKAAIQIRNKYMAERADLVICYIDKKKGGAYNAVCYAEKLGKKIINLAAEDDVINRPLPPCNI